MIRLTKDWGCRSAAGQEAAELRDKRGADAHFKSFHPPFLHLGQEICIMTMSGGYLGKEKGEGDLVSAVLIFK